MMLRLRSLAKWSGRFTYRFHLSYVRTRKELRFILNALGLRGEGAEIGVRHAEFSEWILDHWQGRRLYSIDPWKEFPANEYVDIDNTAQEIQDEIYRTAVGRLARFGDRSRLVRKTSVSAAAQFEDQQLDFVYIDAQHHYEAVKEDLALWLPKVRRGGVMAGHDYLDADTETGVFGVKRAVGSS